MRRTGYLEERQLQVNTTVSVRASVSFPSEFYRTLEEIARQKKVSLTWVDREAAEQNVAGKFPLFQRQGRIGGGRS